MSALAPSYLIVGAGVFGASTALHLSRQDPAPTVILLDRAPFPDPIAASHDINKIVRSDYGDVFYCDLGLKALERWRKDSFFKKWYHQSGLLKITDRSADLDHKIMKNYRMLGVDVKAEMFRPEDLKTRFGGIYADADVSSVEDVLFNPSSGWAEAASALKDTIEAAVNNGVHYVTASVSKLVIKDGSCKSVETADGRTFNASKVILSTGSYTSKLLLDSAPHQPEIQCGNRITAGGVCEASVSLRPEQVEKFKHVPAFVLDANTTQGETMPPTPDNQLKFIRDISFQNTVLHPISGQTLSVPCTDTDRSQWTSPDRIATGLKEEIATVIKGIFGKEGSDLQPSSYRLCWDGTTPDNNWFITSHPRVQDLYIATGEGSWHGWKFLPIIGTYVVQLLKGELPVEMLERWEWDRSFEGLPSNPMMPMRELRDIKI